jgi:hypothetical protein
MTEADRLPCQHPVIGGRRSRRSLDQTQKIDLDLRIEPVLERGADVCGLLAFARNAEATDMNLVRN